MGVLYFAILLLVFDESFKVKAKWIMVERVEGKLSDYWKLSELLFLLYLKSYVVFLFFKKLSIFEF